MLTKSKFVRGMECPKKLWLSENHKELTIDKIDEQAVTEGKEVGKMAGKLFGNYVKVPFAATEEMSDVTKDRISSKERIIAEATFVYGDLACSVDYLENEEDGLVINEVKAKTSVRKDRKNNGESYEAELKPEYLNDVAFQYHVLTGAGYRVKAVRFIILNKDYIRGENLDVDKLFRVDDVTDEVVLRAESIAADIEILRSIMHCPSDPGDMLTLKCKSASRCCDGWEFCGKHIARNSIFDLSGNGRKQEWIDKGLIAQKALLDANVLKGKLKQQAEVQISGESIISRKGIANYISSLKFPLYFFDFESFMDAIPRYSKQWPYEQVTFQYSLHVVMEPGAKAIHREFLGREGEDPRRALVEQLLTDIPEDGGSIIVYHSSFEEGRLKELAKIFPEHNERLLDMVNRLSDMEVPFKERHYYIKEMNGRSSIKVVLPAIFPDDPALDYSRLPGVHKGDEAAMMFKRLQDLDEQERMKQRQYLLMYCELDTFAMVKLYEHLLDVIDQDSEK